MNFEAPMIPDLHAFSIYSSAAGSARVRIDDWTDHLGITVARYQYIGMATAGFSTLRKHPVRGFQAERSVRSVNVAGTNTILSREASPLSRGGLEQRILRQAQHSAYDFDDALFLDQRLSRRVGGSPQKFERSVKAADSVIAGNDYLAEWASQYSPHVRVIPSCVEPARYLVATPDTRRSSPVLVWLGSASTEQYLIPLIPQLRELHRTHNVRLKLISAKTINPELAAIEHMMERVPWQLDSFTSHLASADIGIAPLADTPYTRGKCAYKLLQYGAAGLPLVGSPVGANEAVLRLSGGLSVDRWTDWYDAIKEILDEPKETSTRRGRTARSTIEEHYSFGRWAQDWIRATNLAS